MKRKRLNGEGSIYQRSSDGRWIGAVYLGFDGKGRPIRKTVSAKTADGVREKLRAVQRQVEEGLPPPDDRMTVSQLLKRWQDDVMRHQVGPTSFDNYRSIAKHHIEPALGRRRVSKLTVADVDSLISTKVDEGYSSSTVRRIRAVLSQALDQAVRWGVVGRNVVGLTRGPKATRREGRTLTPEQAKKLLATASGRRLEALYITMLGTGLRPGEVLGLIWTDLDLQAGLLTVSRSLKRHGTMLVLGDVKTSKSRRTVNLSVPIIKALRAHKRRQAEERLAAGSDWSGLNLVFSTEVGTPIDPSNLRRDFKSLCADAGLGAWHPNELRHSAASLMLAEGVGLDVVAEVLGHSSIRMTADNYGHILPPRRQEAADAMARTLWS